MEKKPTELDEDLRKELECPICLEHMKPPISMCENGHSICSGCKPKLKSCPSCKRPFLQVRNLALESLSAMFAKTKSVSKTSESAVKRYKCPFSAISHDDCEWQGSLQDMKYHIKTSHRDSNDSHKSNGRFSVILTNLSPERHYRKAVWSGDELFYVVWEINGGNFFCAMLYVGPKKKSSKFTYRFSLTTENGTKSISMTFKTQSVLQEMEKNFSPGDCVLLHYDTVLKFLNSEECLHCFFEIRPIEIASGADRNQSKHGKSDDVNVDPDCLTDERDLLEQAVKRELLASLKNPLDVSYPPHSDIYRNGRGGRRGRGSGRGRFSRAGRRGAADRPPEPQGYCGSGVQDFQERSKLPGRYSKLGRSLTDLRDASHYGVDNEEIFYLDELRDISHAYQLKTNSSSTLSVAKGDKFDKVTPIVGLGKLQGKVEANNHKVKSSGISVAKDASREHITDVSAVRKQQGNLQEHAPLAVSSPSLSFVKCAPSPQVSTQEGTEDKPRIKTSNVKSTSEQLNHVTVLGKSQGDIQANGPVVKSGLSSESRDVPTSVPKLNMPRDRTETIYPKLSAVTADDYKTTDASPFQTLHAATQASIFKDKAPALINTRSQQSINLSPVKYLRDKQSRDVTASANTWSCPLCGYLVPEKQKHNNIPLVDIAPSGEMRKCKLCGEWRP